MSSLIKGVLTFLADYVVPKLVAWISTTVRRKREETKIEDEVKDAREGMEKADTEEERKKATEDLARNSF